MKFLIEKANVLPDGTFDFITTDIIGQIRIWIADTNKPTDYWLLIQDDGQSISIDNKIDLSDFTDEFNPRIQEIFARAKVLLTDYSKSLKKGFYMDIKIPLSLVQKYQQRIG